LFNNNAFTSNSVKSNLFPPLSSQLCSFHCPTWEVQTSPISNYNLEQSTRVNARMQKLLIKVEGGLQCVTRTWQKK